jgi:3-oxoacyl-[acyl-carrier-protein] synthase-3
MAVEAVNGLLKKRGITAEEIDLIIFATVTSDLIFPSSACLLADKIGAKNAFGVESEFIYKVTLGFTGGDDLDIKNWKLISLRSEEVR